MTARPESMVDYGRSLQRLCLVGFASTGLFAATVGVWAFSATLSGAVIARGQFVVDNNVKKVQHATGGIVSELLVRDGDRVARDQVTIRLDDTVLRANLKLLTQQIDEHAVRRERLRAERDDAPEPEVPAEFASRLNEPSIQALLLAERALFDSRRHSRTGQEEQLAKRVAQSREEIVGLRAQQGARGEQARLIEDELAGVRDLYDKKLVALPRKSALEREAARLEGERGRLIASIALAEARIAETEIQILQIHQALREEVTKELIEVHAKLAEFSERRVAAEDQLKRTEIRAPADGSVHELAVHTVGGVVSPADPVMLIVPSDDQLEVEARVAPVDIDQVKLAQSAELRVLAFNQRVTPLIGAKVSRISADISREPQTGLTFYTIRLSIAPEELARLERPVTAGMQTDVFIRTEDRTPLQYIVKPLRDQISKAFRER